MEHPVKANGKICYIEIPADDVNVSATFFHDVFNWNIRPQNGSISFDDAVGQVSGMWVTGKKSSSADGLIVHIMVDDLEESMNKIVKHGGSIREVIPIGEKEKLALFNDPAGNVFGIYQES